MLIKLIRLGKNSEIRSTDDGKKVLNFTGAYDVGYGQNKKTQWVKCSLWGDRGDKVQQYLKKGTQVVVYLDSVSVDVWKNKDGEPNAALKGNVKEFEFAGGKNNDSAVSNDNGDAFNDDIPF